MRATKKTNTNLPVTTNTKTDISTQTPIEIVLQIDEDGMTTASKFICLPRIRSVTFFKMV